MGNCFLHGNGGAPLNFKVVGNPQPANPRENTIWLNTDYRITTYCFSATPPSGNLIDGAVWISIGTSGNVSFNALKKDCIIVYPLKAMQIVSGTVKDVEAKIYQKGKWERLTYLVDLNANNWTVVPSSNHSHSISNNNGAVIFSATNKLTNIYVRAVFYNKTPIDVTAVNTLEVTCSWNNCVGQDGSLPCYIGLYNKNFEEVATIGPGSALSTSKLDISNLTGEHYVFVNVSMGGSASVSATIEKVELT